MSRSATGHIEARMVNGERHHYIRVRLADGSRPRFLLGVSMSDERAAEKAAAWNARRDDILAAYVAERDAARRARRGAGQPHERRPAWALGHDEVTTCSGVYFVRGSSTGTIKIGRAQNVRSRVKGLQSACSEPLEVLAVLAGDGHEEDALHGRFAHARVHGEWFNPVPELVSYVEQLRAAKGA